MLDCCAFAEGAEVQEAFDQVGGWVQVGAGGRWGAGDARSGVCVHVGAGGGRGAGGARSGGWVGGCMQGQVGAEVLEAFDQVGASCVCACTCLCGGG